MPRHVSGFDLHRHDLEPAEIAALLWPPIAEADPTPPDLQPCLELQAIDQLRVSVEVECAGPIVKLGPRTENAVALYNHRLGELSTLSELFNSDAVAFAVIIEREHLVDD